MTRLSCWVLYTATQNPLSFAEAVEITVGVKIAYFYSLSKIIVSMWRVCLICVPTQLKLDAGAAQYGVEYDP